MKFKKFSSYSKDILRELRAEDPELWKNVKEKDISKLLNTHGRNMVRIMRRGFVLNLNEFILYKDMSKSNRS